MLPSITRSARAPPVLDTGRPKRYGISSATGTAYGKASAPGPDRDPATGCRRLAPCACEQSGTRDDEAIRAVERAIGRGRAGGRSALPLLRADIRMAARWGH